MIANHFSMDCKLRPNKRFSLNDLRFALVMLYTQEDNVDHEVISIDVLYRQGSSTTLMFFTGIKKYFDSFNMINIELYCFLY